MDILVKELKLLADNGICLSALNMALLIPDICSALESEDGLTNGAKYRQWVDTYISPKYYGSIEGNDLYKIRCASLHQGRFNHKNSKYNRILFQIPSKGNNIFHMNFLEDALNLNVVQFCYDMIEGYEAWKKDNLNNPYIERNQTEGINYYPNGLAPYIVGVPLLA